jgi:hypothetical protein
MSARWRSLPAWAGWTSPSWALFALGALLLAGIALRVLASEAAWPALPTLADSWPYSYFAATDPFSNPQHPPGYSLFLALIGLVTHSVGVFVVLQHLLGIASALLLFAAVRRLCGSPWPGVVAAAVVLLGADQLYLEVQIMSEVLFTALLAGFLYAMARALEGPRRWWPWPVVAAVLVVLATMTRTAGLFLVPVAALALLLGEPRPWLPRWRPLAAFIGAVAVCLLVVASVSSVTGNRFGITPSPGWHLYARAAPIADCSQFTPPPGTAKLCETTAPAERFGPDWYLYDPASPALRLIGPLGTEDEKLEAFGREVVLHQPRAFVESVLPDIAAYWFPEDYGPWKSGMGTDIDGQLSWKWATLVDKTQQETQEGMETFFSPFAVHRRFRLINAFYDYQRIVRFGGTMLTIATLLILIGLFVGSRQSRIAILLLGVGGLAIITLPTFSANYVGRYMVPPSGPLAAAGVIGAMSIVSWLRAWRRGRSSQPSDSAGTPA